MSGFFSRMFNAAAAHASGAMDRGYVSEFTRFMDHYLVDHPEVAAEKRAGFRLYWDKQLDLKELAKAERDVVPDDGYGFHPAEWTHGDKQGNKH